LVCALTSESETQAEPPYISTLRPRPNEAPAHTVTQNIPNSGEDLNSAPPLGIPGPIEELPVDYWNESEPWMLPFLDIPADPWSGFDTSVGIDDLFVSSEEPWFNPSIEKDDLSASSQTERFPESNCNAPVPSPLLRIPTEVPVSYEQSLSIEEGSPWVSS